MAYEFEENLEVHAFWRNHKGEVDTSKHAGSWGPIAKVDGIAASEFQFALVQYSDGKHFRLYHQNNAGVVREHCSDDRGRTWSPGYKWGIAKPQWQTLVTLNP